MKNLITKFESFIAGPLSEFAKFMFLVGIAYVLIWIALVGLNS